MVVDGVVDVLVVLAVVVGLKLDGLESVVLSDPLMPRQLEMVDTSGDGLPPQDFPLKSSVPSAHIIPPPNFLSLMKLH